ncbi:MFS transporter [Kitasatospora kazusensis]|uniref:MFS transporter n=1 Tax=Kitasatospora kazusensis TaxID=407974 RepID=A0ABN3A893_9ACTN
MTSVSLGRKAAAPPEAAEPGPGAANRTGAVILASCLGFFLINLDATIVNVALPAIGLRLHASLSDLQWVVAAYTLAFAGLLLSGGTISDRIGATRLFGYGLLAFAVSSAACGFAPDVALLVAARVVQGAAAAAVLPSSLALLRQLLPDPAARTRALALWAAGGGAALSAGPIAGGFLTSLLGWQAIFFVNVPFGLLTVAGLSRAPRSVPRRTSFDLAGQVSAVVALTGFTFAVIEIAPRGVRSPMVLVPLLVSVAALLWFLRVESTVRSPMVDLRELRSRVFVSCLATGFALNFSFYGILFVFSLVFQQDRGWSPIRTGLSFLPMTALVLVSNILAGRLTRLVGSRYPMAGAQLLSACGFLGILATGSHGPTWLLIVATLPIGIGGGLASPPMMTALLESVPAERAGVVSGLLSSCRQAGGALGVTLFGLLISTTGFGLSTGLRLSAAAAGGLLVTAATASFLWIREAAPASDGSSDH